MTPATLPELLRAHHGPPPAGRRGPPAVRARAWNWTAHLLALDPGGTCGWAEFQDGTLARCGQVPGEFAAVEALILQTRPAQVICESYHIYPWEMKSHQWSDCPTPQLIGVIRHTCTKAGLPITLRGAAFTKSWFSDARLKSLGLWQPGKRHANDAIRLGASWLMFGKPEKL